VKKRFLLIPVLVAILVGGIACAAKVTLPEGYEQVSPVVQAMGEHWADPELPDAPTYLVYKGEVIGIEYIWSEDMLQEVPGPPGETIKALAPLPVGAIVDHIDVSWMTPGVHPGPPVDHWDIHIYFITQAEKAAITPED
jgi:hypothetical protein